MQSVLVPLIPLRDIVVFPHMVVTLFVGREKSITAIQESLKADSQLVLVAQKNAADEDPKVEDLYRLGVTARIMQMISLPDGTVKLLVEGLERVRIQQIVAHDGMYQAQVSSFLSTTIEQVPDPLLQRLIKNFQTFAEVNKKISPEFMDTLTQSHNPEKVIDLIAAQLSLLVVEKQELLEEPQLLLRFERVMTAVLLELDTLKIEDQIKNRVKQQMEKNHREYYLSEQMKAIQGELSKEGEDEFARLEKRIKETKFSDEARQKVEAEFKKLRSMNAMSSEATVVRNYLDWLLDLPWGKNSRLKRDITQAQKVLERDHFGLEKVKERILEHLAVQQRLGKTAGTILCLVGPPGVGKTSLGRSIAEATGRQFVRFSLGGMRDESEIRGHRRTYIGAMPGRIIQGMKKAKTNNPVFLLDEVDKLGADWRGDPSSALLEVLDPEQNRTFSDHYLEVDYDLSNVFFIATANSLNIPRPLLDRMEVIRIPGYTEDEKVQIAMRHLFAKQTKANGLKKGEWQLPENVLREVIRHYTSEAGVRNLERQIASLARKVLKNLLTTSAKSVTLTKDLLKTFLGVRQYRYGLADTAPRLGVTTGLAWTEVGGDLLHVEAVISDGKGKLQLTGKLGDVMKESIQAAVSYVRSQAALYGIESRLFVEKDIHVHVPEGATPKDGPSAGVAICTSIISILTGIPVKPDVAMTGEITLRGKVLPIGGLKEKLLAAVRGGIKHVFIPEENIKDLEDVPQNVKKTLTITPVSSVETILKQALVAAPEPLSAEKGATTGAMPFVPPKERTKPQDSARN